MAMTYGLLLEAGFATMTSLLGVVGTVQHLKPSYTAMPRVQGSSSPKRNSK